MTRSRTLKSGAPSENTIQDDILKYLTERGYTCWRQNTVGVYDQKQQRYRTPSKYAVKGVSDVIVLSEGKAYFIEVKSDNGRQDEDQELFQAFVERAGCEYYVVWSVEDVVEAGF